MYWYGKIQFTPDQKSGLLRTNIRFTPDQNPVYSGVVFHNVSQNMRPHPVYSGNFRVYSEDKSGFRREILGLLREISGLTWGGKAMAFPEGSLLEKCTCAQETPPTLLTSAPSWGTAPKVSFSQLLGCWWFAADGRMVLPNIIGWLAGWCFHSQESVDIICQGMTLAQKWKIGRWVWGWFCSLWYSVCIYIYIYIYCVYICIYIYTYIYIYLYDQRVN